MEYCYETVTIFGLDEKSEIRLAELLHIVSGQWMVARFDLRATYNEYGLVPR